MRMRLGTGWLILSLLVAIAQAEDRWNPAKTWVFMVGITEWQDLTYETVPQKNRRDVELAALFEKRGVPADQILFLKDKEATRERIINELGRFLSKCDGTLILYYSGHAAKMGDGAVYFIPYNGVNAAANTDWSIPSIFTAIDKYVKITRTLLFADCTSPLELKAELAKHNISFVGMSASFFPSLAARSWTFTDGLIASFSGEARTDLDHNGKVTLDEAATFTAAEVAFAENQLMDLTTAKFPLDLIITSTVTPTPNPRYGERLTVGQGDDAIPFHVLDADASRVKACFYGFDAKVGWLDTSQVRSWRPTSFPAGSKIQALWTQDDNWYPAVVLISSSGYHYIHFDDYDTTEYDEWVRPEHIKPR